MVTGKKKLITAAAAGCLALALAGTSSLTIAGSPALAAEDKTEDVMHGPDVPPKGMRYDEWKGFQYTTDREFDLRTTEDVMHGPDVPPKGMRYDEWKGFEYTKDTEFDLRTFWTITMYDHSNPESHDLFRDPENVEDAVLKIVDAKSEPVGGEMKLRSGGFVDITVELYWTGTMNGIESAYAYEHYYKNPFYVQWSENAAYPCDAYTGTSLLNYFSTNDDAADDSISPGQASASSMAESDITWNGRTYRLFAQSDIRNASFSDWYERQDGDKYRFTCPAALETTLTFRVPADYDGLVLAIDKDITDERDHYLTENGEFINSSDLYADILTRSDGIKQSADDFYFIRVSDLLEYFKEKH